MASAYRPLWLCQLYATWAPWAHSHSWAHPHCHMSFIRSPLRSSAGCPSRNFILIVFPGSHDAEIVLPVPLLPRVYEGSLSSSFLVFQYELNSDMSLRIEPQTRIAQIIPTSSSLLYTCLGLQLVSFKQVQAAGGMQGAEGVAALP